MLTYTLVFGFMARVPSSEGVPYALCVFCGIVPWNFFSGALTSAANSLITNAAMLSKIYFPRLILPLSEVLARSVELAIGFVLLLIMIAGFGFVPRPAALVMVPLATVVMAMAVVGAGLWLSAMAVQYRDVAYALSFLIQIALFLTPVIYDVSAIPARFLPIFGLNPMVGVIGTYRAVLLSAQPIPWMLFGESIAVSTALVVSGAFYFRRAERLFADVV
jgi:lipopolysaccharide transport system permease protein